MTLSRDELDELLEDLSDSELRSRLVDRGCPITTAYTLVHYRGRPWAASLIRGRLTR